MDGTGAEQQGHLGIGPLKEFLQNTNEIETKIKLTNKTENNNNLWERDKSGENKGQNIISRIKMLETFCNQSPVFTLKKINYDDKAQTISVKLSGNSQPNYLIKIKTLPSMDCILGGPGL